MYRIVSTLNLVFILGLMTLTAFGVRTWTHPEYPLRVDGTNLVGTPRELAPLIVTRKSTPPQSVNEVAQKNLFRQERIEYRPPPPPQSKVAKAPPKPALPAPELSLRGVMLLNGTKIAILEGTYPVLTGNKTEKKPIKRKGYRLGERIGDFEITQIEKRSVTLNNPIGQVLTVKLKRTTPVMNKTRKRKARIISTRPTAKKVEKSRQPASALAPHISGRRTAPPPLHISGR